MASGFNQDDQGFYQGQYGANYPGYSQENTDASGYDIGTSDQFPQDQYVLFFSLTNPWFNYLSLWFAKSHMF